MNVKNLNATNITTGTFNADLIKTGRIQGPDGKFYFDFSSGESAVQALVDQDGDKVIGYTANGHYANVYSNLNVSGYVSASSGSFSGNISASNLRSNYLTVVTNVTLTKIGTEYSLNVTRQQIQYYSPY